MEWIQMHTHLGLSWPRSTRPGSAALAVGAPGPVGWRGGFPRTDLQTCEVPVYILTCWPLPTVRLFIRLFVLSISLHLWGMDLVLENSQSQFG